MKKLIIYEAVADSILAAGTLVAYLADTQPGFAIADNEMLMIPKGATTIAMDIIERDVYICGFEMNEVLLRTILDATKLNMVYHSYLQSGINIKYPSSLLALQNYQYNSFYDKKFTKCNFSLLWEQTFKDPKPKFVEEIANGISILKVKPVAGGLLIIDPLQKYCDYLFYINIKDLVVVSKFIKTVIGGSLTIDQINVVSDIVRAYTANITETKGEII